MKITWVTRSFLDYRIPVYKEINRLCGDHLMVIYYADVVPDRCQDKLKGVLNERAIGLTGEIRFTGKKNQPVSSVNNNKTRIPFQPGLVMEITSTQPDLIISDGFFQWTYAALWLRLIKGIPHLMCYEGTTYTERSRGIVKRTYRKSALKLIDHVACNGSLCAFYVKSLGYPESKISLGNMASDSVAMQVNAKKFSEAERTNLKKILNLNSIVFLSIGRLVKLKGIEKLIDAWSKSLVNNNQSSLLIVGDGPEFECLKEQVRIMNGTNVKFVGAIDYDFIYQYFSIADIFIIPTLQDNWSLVVPEAMSVGLPIICSKYNGCWPELVKPENGWVFDPLEQGNFINTLKEAWEKRNEWKAMGQKSMLIVQDYTPDKVAQNIYLACQKVTGLK